MMAKTGRWALLSLIAAGVVVLAQTAGPAADQPHAGDRNVTGTAPGASSLTVYDISSGGKRYLGSGSSIDKKGFFAVAVNPPLTVEQKIIVVDAQGHSSAAVAVIPPTLPTTPPHPPR